MNTFAYGLKVIYKERGMTQEQLASLVGMNKNTLSKIMSGRVNTTTDKVDSFCDALAVNPSELFQIGHEAKKRAERRSGNENLSNP